MPAYDLDWIVTGSTELLDRCAIEHRAVDVIEVPGGITNLKTVDDVMPAVLRPRDERVAESLR